MATFSAIYLQTMCLKSLQVIQVRETVLRVTPEYQSFHYMKPEIMINIKRMVGECSSSVTNSRETGL